MTRGLAACLVATCLAGSMPAWAETAGSTQTNSKSTAEDKAIALLADAANAVRSVTYSGTIVYLHGGDADTVQVVHRLHDGMEEERLVSQSGEAREVIRKGDKVTSILPEHKIVLVSEQPPRTLLGSVAHFSPARLKKYYSVDIEGDVRFAGRQCRIITIEPDDRYRYGYRMLVDAKTDLPLELILRYKGKQLEQLMFTDVSFPGSLPDNDFLPSYDVRGFKIIRHRSVQMDKKRSANSDGIWKAEHLPPGFRLAEDGVRQVTPTASVRQMLFTDGVATASAFIAPAGLRPPLNGSTRMGAVNAYGSVDGKWQITVVGEIPAITAKRIALNLVHKKSANRDDRDKPPAAGN